MTKRLTESPLILTGSLIVTLVAISAFQLGKRSERSNGNTSTLVNDQDIRAQTSNESSRASVGEESTTPNSKSFTNSSSSSTTTKINNPKPQIPNPKISSSSSIKSITLEPIGHVRSIYKLCVGTPRQGLLAPNSRGTLVLDSNRISSDSVLELEHFSHVWIVFVFHLNSNVVKERKKRLNSVTKSGTNGGLSIDGSSISHPLTQDLEDSNFVNIPPRQFPAKISPPALGGKRVGIFATRTPHRPNPIGVTLCKIDAIPKSNNVKKKKKKKQKKGKKGQKNQQNGSIVESMDDSSVLSSSTTTYSIDVSGLDLVDGTPILDIKPFVPHYDSVGYTPSTGSYNLNDTTEKLAVSDLNASSSARIPQWINDGLEKRRNVMFTSKAELELEKIMMGINNQNATSESTKNITNKNKLMDFYGVSTGRDSSNEEALQHIRSCIIEVLGVDVRSAWQTKKARKGKSQAEKTARLRNAINSSAAISTSLSSNIDTEGRKDIIQKEQYNHGGEEEEEVEMCTQQLDNLLIQYTITHSNNDPTSTNAAVNTEGSGADDTVVVKGISYITPTRSAGVT